MRHRKKGKKLGRKIGPRKALEKRLACALILDEKITTTYEKAKFVRSRVERVITLAAKKSAVSKRKISSLITNKAAEKKLFEKLGPKYKDRKGGYTRLLKLKERVGDGAFLVRLELV